MLINGLEKHNMTNTNLTIIIKNIAFLIGCAIFFVSCEDDDASALPNKNMENLPSQVIKNASIIQRDSGRIKLRGTAPLIEQYELVDTPFIVARKGIHIEFFDKDKPNKPGTIDADSAWFSEKKKFYEAHGNVRINTNDGKKFVTKSLYWDSKKNELYTQDTVYITDTDGSTLISTQGMVAKDDFSEYTFNNNSGEFSTNKVQQE